MIKDECRGAGDVAHLSVSSEPLDREEVLRLVLFDDGHLSRSRYRWVFTIGYIGDGVGAEDLLIGELTIDLADG